MNKKGLITLLALFNVLICSIVVAQSDPLPFYLPGGNYSFTTWSSASAAGTYPPNTIWHRCSIINPLLADPTTSDYTSGYALASTQGEIDGLAGNGFAFNNVATAANNNLGAWVVGLNSAGRTSIVVTFSTQGLSAGVAYGVRLQYRLSTVGTWTDVPGPVEYLATGVTAAITGITANLSTLTANAVDRNEDQNLQCFSYIVGHLSRQLFMHRGN
jgi:hypothetical protein